MTSPVYSRMDKSRKPSSMSVPVEIETYHLYNGQRVIESRKIIDHGNSSDRKWLGSHCHWALRNDRIVITAPYGMLPNFGGIFESN